MLRLSSRNKAIASVILFAVSVLMTMPIIGYAGNNGESENLVFLRARGSAIEIDEVKMPAKMVLVLRLHEQSEKGIPLKIVKGLVEITITRYNITSGEGVVLTKKNAILIKCLGIGPEGENVTLKFTGKWARVDADIYTIRLIGILRVYSSRILLLLKGLAKI